MVGQREEQTGGAVKRREVGLRRFSRDSWALFVLRPLILGGLSAFAFQPFALWPLMPLAFGVLCALIVRARSLRGALAVGWLFGVGQFTIGLNWIATAFTYQAAMPAWLGWVAVVLLSLYLAVYPALAIGLAWRFGQHRPLALVLGLAGSWAITEWLRATMFTGFAWNPVGVTLADTGLMSAARLIGTYGLSAMVVAIGGILWLMARRELASAAGIAAAILLSALTHTVTQPPRHAAFRVVQPNIGQEQKWNPGFAAQAAQRLELLSMNDHRPGPRLLLWPEAAVTEPLDDARGPVGAAMATDVRTRAAALVGPRDDLLTGGLSLASSDGRSVTGAANSVFVLGQGGQLVGRYDKAHLVPYGEYLPMRPILSAIGLSRLAPGDMDFIPGPGPRTIAIPGWGKIGLQVCYEIIFSGEVVDRLDRPEVIFNPSNDAWFGRWGPPQHLAQARLRAAEEGIPVIRSTPTGISALVDARGRLLRSLPWRTAGVIDGDIPPAATAPTPFARGGNLIPLLIGFALLIAAIALGGTDRYRRT